MSLKAIFALIINLLVAAVSFGQETQIHPQETAALKLVQTADEAIAKKDFNRAVASLKQAAKLVPDDMDLQFKLASTLLKADRMPEMWRVLRAASLKNPGHEDIARGLLSYWRMFDEQGLFNCNHEPIEKVIRILGKPDHVVDGGDRTRYVYGFIGIEVKKGQKTIHQTMDLRGLTRDHLTPVDFVSLDMDGRGRKVGHRTTNKGTTLAEFVLPGERVQNWTQLFSVQRMHGLAKGKASLQQIAEGMMASLAKTNPKRKYRFLEASDESVTFEWTAPATEQHKAQHELVRMMRGAIDVHRIAFVVRGTEQMDPSLRDEWVGLLGKAELKPVPDSYSKPEPKTPEVAANADELAWKFGHHLSIFVFAHAQKNANVARPNLIQAGRLARQLQIEMPKPFQLTDDATANVTAAIGYMFEDTLAVLHKKLPDTQVATFELASRSNTLAMVCSNKDLTAKSMLMINKASERSSLPKTLVAALNERIKAGATPEEIRKLVEKLNADAAMYFKNSKSSAAKPAEAKRSAKMTSQVLYMNGSKLGEITADGEVWISGNKVGDITSDGEIWVEGTKEGEITADGEVWKAGNKIGDITKDGEIWRDGNKVGSIEKNGDVWLNGSNVGSIQGGSPRDAAAVLFFGFYDLSA